MNYLITLIAIVVSTLVIAADATDRMSREESQMRPVDRDWAYFNSVPCNEVRHLRHHSRSEEMLIARRKGQCLKKYDAFLPRPVEKQ